MYQINPSAPVPIYRQIVDQIRREVAGGQLKPGDELPSVRSVALLHAVNPMTVSKAYSLLEAEGVLSRNRGMAMTVAMHPASTSHAQRLALLKPHLEAAARAAHELKVTPRAARELFDDCLNARAETHNDKEMK